MWLLMYVMLTFSAPFPRVDDVKFYKSFATYEKCAVTASNIMRDSQKHNIPKELNLTCVPLNQDQWEGVNKRRSEGSKS